MAASKTGSKSDKTTFLIRLVAFIIDMVLLGIVDRILFSGQAMVMGKELAYRNNFWTALIMWAYFVFMDVKYGATLGKMALKIKVVSAKTGKLLTIQEALLREIVGRIVNGLTLGIGYLWVLWDENKQGLHDKIGGSFVVKS